MKLTLTIAMLTFFLSSFGQNNLLLITRPINNEFDFHKVKSTQRQLTDSDLHHFEIIDTILTPYSLIIKSFSTISIAIKKDSTYLVYEVLNKDEERQKISKEISGHTIQKDTVTDSQKKSILNFQNPTERFQSYLYVADVKMVKLDRFGNKELVFKFIYSSYNCPTCAIPLNMKRYEGYVIFDFDKLQALEIITLQSVKFNDPLFGEKMKLEVKKHCLEIGGRKYRYKNNKLVGK